MDKDKRFNKDFNIPVYSFNPCKFSFLFYDREQHLE